MLAQIMDKGKFCDLLQVRCCCAALSLPDWGEGPLPEWLREPSHWLAPPGPPKWLLPKLFWRKVPPGAEAMECAGVAGGVAAGVPKGVPAHVPHLVTT